MSTHRIRIWSARQHHGTRLWRWYCRSCEAHAAACDSHAEALRRGLIHVGHANSEPTRSGARDPRGLDIHP